MFALPPVAGEKLPLGGETFFSIRRPMSPVVTGRLIAVDCRVLIQQVAGAAPGEALRGKPITDSVTGIRENHRPAKKRISRAM